MMDKHSKLHVQNLTRTINSFALSPCEASKILIDHLRHSEARAGTSARPTFPLVGLPPPAPFGASKSPESKPEACVQLLPDCSWRQSGIEFCEQGCRQLLDPAAHCTQPPAAWRSPHLVRSSPLAVTQSPGLRRFNATTAGHRNCGPPSRP